MRINIEIGDIEAFIELTETNSFAKAANNLNLSQPALSRRIQKLEHELGTTLFDRTTRKVQLSYSCLLYTSPSPRDATLSRMPSSA